MQTNKELAPFFLFQQNEKFYMFDGSSGNINEVQKILFDILSKVPEYNLFDEDERLRATDSLEAEYTREELEDTWNQFQSFYNDGFLQPNQKIYDSYEKSSADTLKGQCLWLNISHNCNLRCVYCFGDGGSYGGQQMLMDQKIAKQCIDLWLNKITRSQMLHEVSFFGGEPLMNIDVLEFCVNYINEKTNPMGVNVRYNLTTNGTILNDRIIKLFKDNNFKVSISIDGIERMHNSNRPYVSGKGSFDDIVQNIIKLKDIVPDISAQITLMKKDISYLKDAVVELWKLGITFVYSNLVFGKDELYSEADYSLYKRQIKDLSELTYNNLVQGKRPVYQNLLNTMWMMHMRVFTANCFYWTGGAMIFSPSGKAYSCYRFVENEKFCVGDITDGDLILNGQTKECNKGCSECWAQLYCGDGCVYENSIYHEDLNEPADEWCNKTKASLEESMKLYIRLKEDANDTFNKIFKIRG